MMNWYISKSKAAGVVSREIENGMEILHYAEGVVEVRTVENQDT